MTDKHAKIDELIEESYLAMLSEEHIRRDLLQFLETCHRCVAESNLDDGRKASLAARLDDFRGLALRVDSEEGMLDDEEEWAGLTGRDRLAHRAARLKMMVLGTIRETAPAFADELERKRFPNVRDEHAQGSPREEPPKADAWEQGGVKLALIQALYAIMAGVTVFLIIYRMFFI